MLFLLLCLNFQTVSFISHGRDGPLEVYSRGVPYLKASFTISIENNILQFNYFWLTVLFGCDVQSFASMFLNSLILGFNKIRNTFLGYILNNIYTN